MLMQRQEEMVRMVQRVQGKVRPKCYNGWSNPAALHHCDFSEKEGLGEFVVLCRVYHYNVFLTFSAGCSMGESFFIEEVCIT
jgi:hypothetical protein